MKKLLPLLLCTLLLFGCGRADTTPSVSAGELLEMIVQQSGVENASFSETEDTLLLLGLEEGSCTEASGFQAMDGAMPQQGFILVCSDSASVKSAVSALEQLLSVRMEQSRAYSPADYAVAEKCRVATRGLWVSLFLSSLHEEQEMLYSLAFSSVPLPTLTPEPMPTPIQQLPEKTTEEKPKRVADSWFDDALFVGDSVEDSMRIYVNSQRSGDRPNCMGKITFFCMQNFSFARAADDNLNNLEGFPIYRNKACRVETAVKQTGCKKLLIGMGANELPGNGADKTIGYVEKLMELCQEVNPELEIYLMNHIPSVYAERQYGLDNRVIVEFNDKLRTFCEEKGYHYLDIYSAVANEEGLLSPEDCRDPQATGIHPAAAACARWLEYLYTHCGEAMTNEEK